MAENRLRTVTLAVTIAVLVATVGTTGSAAAAAESTTEPAFVVGLEPDGDATVSLVVTYDLADDSDQQAFKTLRDDPSAITGEFEQRLSQVVARTAVETDREMSISGVDANFETVDRRGIVRVSAQWKQLADSSGEQLTLSEPFASDFQPDRRFVVNAPEGYELAKTSHTPATQEAGTAQWGSGTSLTGFSTTFTADGTTSTDESLPTPLSTVLLLGVLTAVGYAGWQRLSR